MPAPQPASIACYVRPKQCPPSRSLLEILTEYQTAIDVKTVDFVPPDSFPNTLLATPALFVPDEDAAGGLCGMLYGDDAFEYVRLRQQKPAGARAGMPMGGSGRSAFRGAVPDMNTLAPEPELSDDDAPKPRASTRQRGADAPPEQPPPEPASRGAALGCSDVPQEVRDGDRPLSEAELKKLVQQRMGRRRR